MVHFFTKIVYEPLLIAEIKSSVIGPELVSVSSAGDFLTIETLPLTGSQVVMLSEIVLAHIPDNTMAVYSNFLDEAVDFGVSLVKQYGLKNRLRGYSTEQIIQVAGELNMVNTLLRAGAIDTARHVIANYTPTNEVTEADKLEFIQRIDAFLGA